MFTGDRSGDVLYEALYDVGLASQPTAVSADDGLELYGVRITSPVRCAPPANKPTPEERDTCRSWLVERTGAAAADVEGRGRTRRLRLAGGAARVRGGGVAGSCVPRPRPRVRTRGTGQTRSLDGLDLFGCFHVSQRNTFTGKLTPAMLRDVLRTAAGAAGLPTVPGTSRPRTTG
jgi:uracil-DNA glycosylase